MRNRNPKGAEVKENLKDMTLISRNASIDGDIKFTGSLRVEGNVKGNLIAESDEGHLTVGESGVIEGQIRVPNIIVNGTVKGDIHSTKHVELAAKARVTGNVHYALIEIVMGAAVNGSLLHQDSSANAGPVPSAIKESAKG